MMQLTESERASAFSERRTAVYQNVSVCAALCGRIAECCLSTAWPRIAEVTSAGEEPGYRALRGLSRRRQGLSRPWPSCLLSGILLALPGCLRDLANPASRLGSAHDSGVAQRVAPGLGPHAETVRSQADRDAGPEFAGAGVDGVDLCVVAAAQPERASVGRDPAHVRAGRWRDHPGGDDTSRGEADD